MAKAKEAAEAKPVPGSGSLVELTEGVAGLDVSSTGKKKQETTYAAVAVKSLIVHPDFNPRAALGDLKALTESIKKGGLVNAITVRPTKKDGEYHVVAGERRLEAVKALGWATVPVAIRFDLEDSDRALAVAVAENSEDGRFTLNPIELGRSFKKLAKKGWNITRIAAECGVHVARVRRNLQLMEAPKDVREKVEAGPGAGGLSATAGLELAKLDSGVREAIKDALGDNPSGPYIRKLAKAQAKAAGAATTPGKTVKNKGASRDASLRTWKGSKAKQAIIAELCYYVAHSEADEVGTGDYHELRGGVAALLWDRSDLDTPLAPPMDPADADGVPLKEAKAALKMFDALVKAEAKKYTPPAAE